MCLWDLASPLPSVSVSVAPVSPLARREEDRREFLLSASCPFFRSSFPSLWSLALFLSVRPDRSFRSRSDAFASESPSNGR